MNTLALIAAVIVGFIAARLLFKLLFRDLDDFWECLRYAFTPDIISMFRGEYWEDYIKSLQLGLYVILVGGAGAMTYFGVSSIGSGGEGRKASATLVKQVGLTYPPRVHSDKHVLDDCHNDGTMWRASVDSGIIGGPSVEFLIPLDEENYREGDPVPDRYKEIYDLYVANETRLKPAVADLLLGWSEATEHRIGFLESPSPDQVFEVFELSLLAIPADLSYNDKIVEMGFETTDRSQEVPEIIVDLEKGILRFAR